MGIAFNTQVKTALTGRYILSFQVLTVQMMIVPARVMKCHGNRYGCHLTVILIMMLSGKKITGQFVSVGDIFKILLEECTMV